MKKRSKHYKPTQTSVPMLINRLVYENVETIEEHSMLVAFKFGVATKQHFDYLARMSNMLNIAAQTKELDGLARYVDALNVLSKSILDRFKRTNKFGVTGEELITLKNLVGVYDQFWKTKTTTFYNNCVAELNAFYVEIQEKRAA